MNFERFHLLFDTAPAHVRSGLAVKISPTREEDEDVPAPSPGGGDWDDDMDDDHFLDRVMGKPQPAR